MKRSVPLSRGVGPKRTTKLKQGKGFAASKEQRAKVKATTAGCYVCGWMGPEHGEPLDPAHLTPRANGGCDAGDCVIPLCRTHHREYDTGKLDLLAIFADPAWREMIHPELAHMLTHLSPVEMVETLANARIQWREVAA